MKYVFIIFMISLLAGCNQISSSSPEDGLGNLEGPSVKEPKYIYITPDQRRSGLSCGITDKNEIRCWGNQGYMIENQPQSLNFSPGPMVEGKWEKLTISGSEICGLKDTGRLLCWGLSIAGGITFEMDDVKDIISTAYIFCALRESGHLACRDVLGSQIVSNYYNVKSAAISYARICMVYKNDLLECKRPYHGEKFETPIKSEKIKSIHTASQATCGIDYNSKATCWFSSHWNFGSIHDVKKYENVIDVAFSFSENYRYNTTLSQYCVLFKNGKVNCEYNKYNPEKLELTPPPEDLPLLKKIQGGWMKICGTTLANEAYCWGDSHGEFKNLISGTTRKIKQIVLQPNCAISMEDEVVCQNSKVKLKHKVKQVVNSDRATCALLQDKESSVKCWGIEATQVNLVGVERIEDDNYSGQFCAYLKNGGVSCWNSWDRYENEKIYVPALEDISSIALTSGFSCLTHGDNNYRCWGDATGFEEMIYFLKPVKKAVFSGTLNCFVEPNGKTNCWNYKGKKINLPGEIKNLKQLHSVSYTHLSTNDKSQMQLLHLDSKDMYLIKIIDEQVVETRNLGKFDQFDVPHLGSGGCGVYNNRLKCFGAYVY